MLLPLLPGCFFVRDLLNESFISEPFSPFYKPQGHWVSFDNWPSIGCNWPSFNASPAKGAAARNLLWILFFSRCPWVVCQTHFLSSSPPVYSFYMARESRPFLPPLTNTWSVVQGNAINFILKLAPTACMQSTLCYLLWLLSNSSFHFQSLLPWIIASPFIHGSWWVVFSVVSVITMCAICLYP